MSTDEYRRALKVPEVFESSDRRTFTLGIVLAALRGVLPGIELDAPAFDELEISGGANGFGRSITDLDLDGSRPQGGDLTYLCHAESQASFSPHRSLVRPEALPRHSADGYATMSGSTAILHST